GGGGGGGRAGALERGVGQYTLQTWEKNEAPPQTNKPHPSPPPPLVPTKKSPPNPPMPRLSTSKHNAGKTLRPGSEKARKAGTNITQTELATCTSPASSEEMTSPRMSVAHSGANEHAVDW